MTSSPEGGRCAYATPSSPRAIAHDLRQPLAAIGALVTSAEQQADVPQKTRRRLHQIRGQLEELNKLCLRIVADKEGPQTDVAIHEIVSAAAEMAGLATGRPVTVAAVNGFVRGDAVDLRRALLNLLENAIRATQPDGQVCIRMKVSRREVRVEVHDDGPGFSRRVPGVASLGLRIVDAVAAEHGGYVEIAESDLGGAAVTLVLPVRMAVSQRRDARTAPSATELAWSDKTGEDQCVS